MIKINNISKSYKTYTVPLNSLKSFLINLKEYKKQTNKIKVLNVIKNFSIEIAEGEILGIIGPNGVGKSTLAKLIAGTVSPDVGEIITKGRIVPFLELGVAFSSELTAKDNVFLNGVLLGLSLKYIKENFNKIFEFAEVQDFIDTPLKYFSSGMQMRLAFSIAMHANGDIFIFDEILAVGDSNFQKKCFNSFHNLIEQKKTIIMIMHDLEFLKKYADKILQLKKSGSYELFEDKNEIAELNSD
ncbi:ABC transporter ATP-binding protein [bacterium]